MIDKEQLRAAYLAGYFYAKEIEYGAEIYVEDRGFEEWYEREITDPPEGPEELS